MDVHDLAFAFLNHAIQLTLLASLVWCVARLFAKNRPHLAHALWILVLIKCVVPPAWSSPTSLFNLSAFKFSNVPLDSSPLAVRPMPKDEDRAENELKPDSSNLQISIVVSKDNKLSGEPESTASERLYSPSEASRWLPFMNIPKNAIVFGISAIAVGFLAGLLLTCARLIHFLKTAYSNGYYYDPEMDDYVRQLSKRLGVKRHVSVRLVRNPIGPVVLGVIRPKLLVPDLIVRGRKLAELEPLIAHELIHIRRGDLWWSMLQTVATSLWWFHPLIRLAGQMVSRETERSCDEETVASLGCSPAAYARSLLDVLERKHQLQIAPALPGVRPIEVTLDRMERIMKLGQGSHKRAPRWIWAAMIVGCCIALPNGSASVAQDTNLLATTSKVAETPPKASPQVVDPVLSYREDVGDLLDALKDQGKTPEDARRWILGQLPLRQVALALVQPEKLLRGRVRNITPLQQIVDRELQASGTVSEIQEVKRQLRLLRATCKKQVSCEVKVMRLKQDDFEEVSAKWSLTRINPNGVRTFVDGKEQPVLLPSVDARMKAALDDSNSQLGLAFDFARPFYALEDEELDAILKHKEIQQAPRVTGRSGQTVTMNFQLESKADDNDFLSQGTCLELTPTLIDGDRISLLTKYSNPSINKGQSPWHDAGSHGKRVLEAMRVQNPNGFKDVKQQLARSHYQSHFLTEARDGQTHVICVPTQVDGEDGALIVLIKCAVVDAPQAGTSIAFDKRTADANGFVNVGGAVKKPDRYELDKPTNVAQAIAAAGGIQGPASERGTFLEVSILRQVNDIHGRILTSFILDPTKLGKEATQADELWLKAMDIFFVKTASPTITIEQAKQLSRANHKQIVEFIPVLGPTTAGSVHEIPRLDPNEVLQALHKSLNTNGRYAFGSRPYNRIESEIIAESKDEKRFIPLIGEAVLHHTFYKCTVYFKDSDERREVLIDHNHFHME